MSTSSSSAPGFPASVPLEAGGDGTVRRRVSGARARRDETPDRHRAGRCRQLIGRTAGGPEQAFQPHAADQGDMPGDGAVVLGDPGGHHIAGVIQRPSGHNDG
jgi:hypothetical protein